MISFEESANGFTQVPFRFEECLIPFEPLFNCFRGAFRFDATKERFLSIQ